MNCRVALLIGLLVSTASPAVGGELSPWEQEMTRAREAKRNVAFTTAARHLSRAFKLSRSPLEEATTYLEFADLLVEKLRYPLVEPRALSSSLRTRLPPLERAEKYYRRAIELGIEAAREGSRDATRVQIRATNNLSALLIETGQHKRAEKLLRSSLSDVVGADRAVYLYNLSLAIEGRGRESEAFHALVEAARAETGSRSTLELVERRLMESEELQQLEPLRAALDVALAREEWDFAEWAVTRLLKGDAGDASVTALIRYLARAEISVSEFRETWVPKVEPLEDRLSLEWRFLWGVVEALFEEPPSNVSCRGSLIRSVLASGGAALEELVQVRAARAYRSGDSVAALCLYERLQSLNPVDERAAVYALTLLTEEGEALDPGGGRLLALVKGYREISPTAEVLLAQGDALAALARRTGDPRVRQRANETWQRGLDAAAEPETAEVLANRLDQPIPPDLWIPNLWDRGDEASDSPSHVEVVWSLPVQFRNPGTTFWTPAWTRSVLWPLATDMGTGGAGLPGPCAPELAIGTSGCPSAFPLMLHGLKHEGVGVPAFGFQLPPPWAPNALLIQQQKAQSAVTLGVGGCSTTFLGLGGARYSCWLF